MSHSVTLQEERFLELPKAKADHLLNEDFISHSNNQLIMKFSQKSQEGC